MGGNGGASGHNQAGRSGGPREDLSNHKTVGVKCDHCGVMGHTKAQCWSANPHLKPPALGQKQDAKRQRQMASLWVHFAQERQTRRDNRTREEEHFSLGYEYRGGNPRHGPQLSVVTSSGCSSARRGDHATSRSEERTRTASYSTCSGSFSGSRSAATNYYAIRHAIHCRRCNE